jgi:WD40 repeat protein
MDFKPSVKTLEQLGEPPISVSAIGIRILHHRDPVTNGLRPDTATLAISPDGSTIVTHYFNVNARTVVTERDGARILLAVSDYFVDRRGIYISHAFFTPDSRYLLLLSNVPAIYIYDTKTWKSVTSLPGLPTAATAFYPSSDWKHGVAMLPGGRVEAWDLSKGQRQSDLDLDGNLQDVSFSKDGSLFAASSVRLNPDGSSTFHLRVWDANTGRFLREMIPPYYFEHDVISRPMWWRDGKYLLANVRAGHLGGYMIAVWNVQSGQLRGGFSACDSSQDPFEVGIDGPRLLKWCFDDTLLVWDIPSAVEQVTEFEQALNGSR